MKVSTEIHVVIDLAGKELELFHDILLNAKTRMEMPELKEANKEHFEFCTVLLLQMP